MDALTGAHKHVLDVSAVQRRQSRGQQGRCGRRRRGLCRQPYHLARHRSIRAVSLGQRRRRPPSPTVAYSGDPAPSLTTEAVGYTMDVRGAGREHRDSGGPERQQRGLHSHHYRRRQLHGEGDLRAGRAERPSRGWASVGARATPSGLRCGATRAASCSWCNTTWRRAPARSSGRTTQTRSPAP